jgi:excisionase family DNA binding protein
MMNNTMFTVRQVAQRFAISKATVFTLVHSGELKATRIGNQLRFREEDLREYEERNVVKAA